MTANTTHSGNGGRPRLVNNEQIFQATSLTLVRFGSARLTLEAVAHEAGFTAPALSRRFGSKKALLEAYLEWTFANMRRRFAIARQTYSSPLTALRERVRLPIDERLEEFGTFTGWYEMSQDPDLRRAVDNLKDLWQHEVTQTIVAARERGELIECDADRLGRNLAAALAGATVLWPTDDSESLPQELVVIVDSMTAPYRAEPASGCPGPSLASASVSASKQAPNHDSSSQTTAAQDILAT